MLGFLRTAAATVLSLGDTGQTLASPTTRRTTEPQDALLLFPAEDARRERARRRFASACYPPKRSAIT